MMVYLRVAVLSTLALCMPLMAQEGGFKADLRREKQEVASSCSKKDLKALAGCAQVLLTGKPLHIAVESFPPGNGLGFGLGFHEEYNTTLWRLSLDSVGDATLNASWKAGIYGKAIFTGRRKIVVVTEDTGNSPATPSPSTEPRRPTFNLQLETITLNQLAFYGLGNDTSKSNRAFYGMDHRFAGINAEIPLRAGLAVLGELGGRSFSLRGRHGQDSPSIEQIFSPASAPGHFGGESYLQTGGGISFDRQLGRLLRVNYLAKLQQFHATDSSIFSFRRFTANVDHRFAWLHTHAAANGNKTSAEVGSVSLSGTLIESIARSGSVVPFYLQPTLGGTDINHDRRLSSYPDYRYRAPNLWVARATVEHIIKGPVGAIAWAESGKVGLTRDSLDFSHLRHSFAVGATLKAGNFPFLSLLFAWGGHEGTHTIVDIKGLGTSKGPSLY